MGVNLGYNLCEMSALRKIRLYLGMIKFAHSIFALPFAFTAALLASGGMPPLGKVLWIAVAMVGARSGAMGLNRVIDMRIDAENPRTATREIPAGKISKASALGFSILSLGVMVYAAAMLNPLCLQLSPLAIAVLVAYSYAKRFTWGAHFILGVALAFAPLGAWVAIRGTLDIEALPLVLAVLLWLPGFDVLYALQDMEYDRRVGLFSIPARFGVRSTLYISRLLHLCSWSLLVLNGFIFGLGLMYWIGMAVVAALFIYEHSLVKEDDLSRLDMAFFNMNGYISVSVFVFTVLSYALS